MPVSGSRAFLPIAVVTWLDTSAALSWFWVQNLVLSLQDLGSITCERSLHLPSLRKTDVWDSIFLSLVGSKLKHEQLGISKGSPIWKI